MKTVVCWHGGSGGNWQRLATANNAEGQCTVPLVIYEIFIIASNVSYISKYFLRDAHLTVMFNLEYICVWLCVGINPK